MADHVTPEIRSRIMRAVKTTKTGPEVILRNALVQRGVRYRIHHKVLGTKVDFAIVGARVAIFVDGCFWHGCPRHYKVPKTNVDFWEAKVNLNVARDLRVDKTFVENGWNPLRFWSCEIREDVDAIADLVVAILHDSSTRTDSKQLQKE